MKILFLDVDGPLIPARAWAFNADKKSSLTNPQFGTRAYFDPIALSLIVRILKESGGLFVVSSSLRILGHKKWLQVLEVNNVPVELMHHDWHTPQLSKVGRAGEILDWVSRHHPKLWVAVDDENLVEPHKENTVVLEARNFVHVTMRDGILFKHANEIAQKLGLEGSEWRGQ